MKNDKKTKCHIFTENSATKQSIYLIPKMNKINRKFLKRLKKIKYDIFTEIAASKQSIYHIPKINKIDESSANLIIRNTNPFYTFSTLLVELIGTKEYFK